jgi:hypothetical protein
MWQIIVQGGKAILQKVENGVVTGEQIVVKFLVHEAKVAVAFFQTALNTPQIQASWTAFIVNAEQQLAAAAANGEQVLEADIPSWIAGAETWLANIVEAKKLGAGGNLLVELGDEGLQELDSLAVALARAALARVVTTLTGAKPTATVQAAPAAAAS